MTKTAIDLAREVLELDRREFGLDDSYNDYHRQYENRRNGLVAASSALLSVQERLDKAEEALTHWIEDAAARLDTYLDLANKNLIGDEAQVRVALIMPTLAMIEFARQGYPPQEQCEFCDAEFRPGMKYAATEEGSGVCEKCAPPETAIYTKESYDVERAITRARAFLQEQGR